MKRLKVRRESLSVMVSTRGFSAILTSFERLSHKSSSFCGSGGVCWGVFFSLAGMRATSSVMFSKAACVRQFSIVALFLRTVFWTRRMLVEIERIPSSRERGVQLLSIADKGSLICCSSRRSRVSCQSASASDSKTLPMYIPLHTFDSGKNVLYRVFNRGYQQFSVVGEWYQVYL